MNRIKYTDIVVSELASLPSGGMKVINDAGETLYEGPLIAADPIDVLKEAYAVYMAPDEYQRFRAAPYVRPTKTEKVQ